MSFWYWLRIRILSVFKKSRQKSYLIKNMLVLSISEWSQIWQIHEPVLKTFPPKEPLAVFCTDLLGLLPLTKAGNEHLFVIVDRFYKMTRAISLQRIDTESIAAAFLDPWVADYGPPATLLSDNGPQSRFTFFQGV